MPDFLILILSLAATIKSEERSYVYSQPDCYSLLDFINVKNGKMFKRLTELKKLCENHTNSCQVRKTIPSVTFVKSIDSLFSLLLSHYR